MTSIFVQTIWHKAAIGVALLLSLSGCGSKVRTYPASGQVKLADGSPLPAGFVSFRSLDHPDHLCARATIQPDGTFELMTFKPGDGAVAGKHQVLVTTPEPTDRPGFESPRTPQVAAKFTSYETSGLEFTVTNNPQNNRFELNVARNR